MNMLANCTFDTRDLRSALGRFFTGVAVVTTIDSSGAPWGVTVNSFTSVSLEPPLILWNQSITSKSHAVFHNANRFTINVLAQEQEFLSKHFARSGPDKFSGTPFTIGTGNIPFLDGCCAVFECCKVATHDGGDHAIFIGEVEIIHFDHTLNPLLFGDGQYQRALLV